MCARCASCSLKPVWQVPHVKEKLEDEDMIAALIIRIGSLRCWRRELISGERLIALIKLSSSDISPLRPFSNYLYVLWDRQHVSSSSAHYIAPVCFK